MSEIQRPALLFARIPTRSLLESRLPRVTKNKQQQQRDHHRNQPATGIAHDLARLWDFGQRTHAAPERDFTHAYALSQSLMSDKGLPIVDFACAAHRRSALLRSSRRTAGDKLPAINQSLRDRNMSALIHKVGRHSLP